MNWSYKINNIVSNCFLKCHPLNTFTLITSKS